MCRLHCLIFPVDKMRIRCRGHRRRWFSVQSRSVSWARGAVEAHFLSILSYHYKSIIGSRAVTKIRVYYVGSKMRP